MAFKKILCLCAVLVNVINAVPIHKGTAYDPDLASLDYYAYPKYAFDYAVKDPHTGDNKMQWEKRDGEIVKGAYSLVEPDGTIRVVEYTSDPRHGFNAVVRKIGHAIHPQKHLLRTQLIPYPLSLARKQLFSDYAPHGPLFKPNIYRNLI